MRNTIQRQLILDAVKSLNIHASAEQVYEHVVKQHPTISKATVYRNLNQLASGGDLLNIGPFYNQSHFDHNCHVHYHFVCEACGRIVDVDGDFSEMFNKIKEISGVDVSNASFSGICPKCK